MISRKYLAFWAELSQVEHSAMVMPQSHQSFSKPITSPLQTLLLLIRQGTLPFGGIVPNPNTLSSGPSISSVNNSISSAASKIAEVSIISRLAKCRPGHKLRPPPYGTQLHVQPSSEKYGSATFPSPPAAAAPFARFGSLIGPLFGLSGRTRNRSAQNRSSGCGSCFVPAFQMSGSMSSVRVEKDTASFFLMCQPRREKSSRVSCRTISTATRRRRISA